MKNIKRSARKYGRVLGHRKGIEGKELLGYFDARVNIYLPSYEHVLKTNLKNLLDIILDLSLSKTLVLLDYETNLDIGNTSKPLSHAGLVRNYLENNGSFKF